jgi:hypothetical protein
VTPPANRAQRGPARTTVTEDSSGEQGAACPCPDDGRNGPHGPTARNHSGGAARPRAGEQPGAATGGRARTPRGCVSAGPGRRVYALRARTWQGGTGPAAIAAGSARHSVPEVTVDVDGVVVELEPRRLKVALKEMCTRPLPSDAGSSPKDTQLSEQICASKQSVLSNNSFLILRALFKKCSLLGI